MKGIIICTDDPYFTNRLIEDAVKSIVEKYDIKIEKAYIIKDFFDFRRTYKTLLIIGLSGVYKLFKIKKKNINQVLEGMQIKQEEYDNKKILTDHFDIAFVFNSNKVFRKKVLDKANYGFLNLHFGPLPRYRGIMPAFWQHRFNEEKIGISYYKMDTGIDTGDLLYQDNVEILITDNLVDIYQRAFKVSSRIIMGGLENLFNGRLITQKDLPLEGTYYGMPGLRDIFSYKFKKHAREDKGKS